jgi:hypothetical protein
MLNEVEIATQSCFGLLQPRIPTIHVFLTNIPATVVVDVANSLKTHVVRLENRPEMPGPVPIPILSCTS